MKTTYLVYQIINFAEDTQRNILISVFSSKKQAFAIMSTGYFLLEEWETNGTRQASFIFKDNANFVAKI